MRASWVKEPLVHFLVLGGIVYLALTWGGEPIDPSSRVIEVGKAEQAQLSLRFESLMGRAPTDAELDARIEQFVRDEVLYREALRLGLDQNDAVVRQRMVSKMDMSASAAAEAAQPDDATLRAYFDDNPDRYAGPTLVSFDQVYFVDRADAQSALEVGNFSGEGISLPDAVEVTSVRGVQARFGEVFARALVDLELASDGGSAWQGPVPSGFGWHLVRLRERKAERPEFVSVRDQVENDWRSEEIAQRKTRAFEVLRSAYRVEIDR
ncbi:peptidyl-prolyl cis-trans isomerase [Erythrobacter sp. Alg231-14]|uniref:peptidyl-prolyl cis-trans isomerase n=1 Tax=Erythrobacter sp. Alg231-14 TaxID=1922225 RepID=UPI000D558DEF